MSEYIENEEDIQKSEDLNDLRVKRQELVASVVRYRVGFYSILALGWFVPFAFYAYVTMHTYVKCFTSCNWLRSDCDIYGSFF